MRDPFEGVGVRGRKAMLLTAAGAVLLLSSGTERHSRKGRTYA